ncbi:hypothetical protein, partial [Gilvimarinus sp. 1_MG-2023]|uniref:hypothetical protein n=1 Tax=Gilvimarinus sp. 1_MG-2023 TaxID=3062638 RepID=UPI0026E2887A
EVQDFNQYAGTITLINLPVDLVELFREREITHIPKELAKDEIKGDVEVQPVATDWNQHASALKLAAANLIGSWKVNNEED